MRRLPSGTVTFLFTDIEGSTRLLEKLGEEAYAQALAEHRRVIRETCGREGGVEVDTQGDAFFFAFPTAPGGIDAARQAQEELSIPVRMGLHTGTPLLSGEGYVGSDVHKAARIASAGHGGQVLVSAATAALAEAAGELRDLGEHRLKDLSAPERIYQLGEHDFPPLKTLYRTNLPVPATPFLGRRRELQELGELLQREEPRLLTLSGPGGTGKTRLALQAAAAAAESYPDGVFWVPLAPLRDPALVLEQVGRAVGASAGPAEHLGDRRLLLLLDNFEQVVQAAPSLGELLAACPNLKVVVTSRELLRVAAEVEYPVPTLAETEAVELFCSRAQVEPDETVAELCRRLDELPLALELAAVRVRILSPQQLLERLGARLDLLKGGRDADPRQQTLRATIEWSHDLLTPEEQRLFAHLAVFRGGCTLEAAEEVAGADLDLLQSLVDKSLLRYSAERFWMLETIREFAAERLADTGEEDELGRMHAEHFLRRAETAESAASSSETESLFPEEDNLRAALGWSCDGGHAEVALALLGALWRFYWIRGSTREPTGWYEKALAFQGAPEAIRAKALYGYATMALLQGDTAVAVERFRACLAYYRRVEDRVGVTRCLNDLGIAQNMAGSFGAARQAFEESLAVATDLGHAGLALSARTNLAGVLIAEGSLDAAHELLTEVLTTWQEREERDGAAATLAWLAIIELRRGLPELAAEWLREIVSDGRAAVGSRILVHAAAVAAAVVNARDDPRACARISAGCATVCKEAGLALDHLEAEVRDEALEHARKRLGETGFEAAWAAGPTSADELRQEILAALA
jgi:predicted ATPase